jgi:hypothetical protein
VESFSVDFAAAVSLCVPLQFLFYTDLLHRQYKQQHKDSYIIVPFTNFSTYLHNHTSAMEVNLNISANSSSEKL